MSLSRGSLFLLWDASCSGAGWLEQGTTSSPHGCRVSLKCWIRAASLSVGSWPTLILLMLLNLSCLKSSSSGHWAGLSLRNPVWTSSFWWHTGMESSFQSLNQGTHRTNIVSKDQMMALISFLRKRTWKLKDSLFFSWNSIISLIITMNFFSLPSPPLKIWCKWYFCF